MLPIWYYMIQCDYCPLLWCIILCRQHTERSFTKRLSVPPFLFRPARGGARVGGGHGHTNYGSRCTVEPLLLSPWALSVLLRHERGCDSKRGLSPSIQTGPSGQNTRHERGCDSKRGDSKRGSTVYSISRLLLKHTSLSDAYNSNFKSYASYMDVCLSNSLLILHICMHII